MDKMKEKSTGLRCRPSTRRLIQLYSALLCNAQAKGFITGEIYKGDTKALCVPGLNCYSCPGAVGACPLGSLQNALASAGHRAPWYILGNLLLFGVMLGRTICGWLCPVGLIQELLHKIPTPKIRKSRVTRVLSLLKYVILLVFVVVIPLWYGLSKDLPLPGFCKFICPAGTLEGAIGLLPANPSFFSMLGTFFTSKFVIMLVIALACIFCYRSFCRFLCPLGAIYGLFNRFSVVGVKVDADRCTRCGACVSRCPMDVRSVGSAECIQCGKCMDVCAQGAISLKAGRITLKAPETGPAADTPEKKRKRRNAGRIAWGIALAVLCFAVLWFNVLSPTVRNAAEPPAVSWDSEAPVGYEPGQLLQDFSIECYDGTVFRSEEYRGKIVFINLWGTWCTPCIKELPYFDDLLREHDDVVVLAVHPSMVVDDPAKMMEDKGYSMFFATDAKDDALWKIVNGGSTLPQTIVLNRRGEVIYNKVGSVTPEMLAALYEEADKSTDN